ncbi:MAG: nitroreductase family deazaflavin-dependent oxidoreductase [Chloroflexi bacterium]|nr:nitroreductase family deazaflavin-dependent oxidoreductase [Chloroflexota bacterium]
MTTPQNRNTPVIEEFRANGGKVGGRWEGGRLLLLGTTGAKSGAKRVTPMTYLPEDDVLYVFGSKAGADVHPDWYHNLVANPDVTVEVGTESYEAIATPLERAERDRVYAAQTELAPGFKTYQDGTERIIPVVAIRRK